MRRVQDVGPDDARILHRVGDDLSEELLLRPEIVVHHHRGDTRVCSDFAHTGAVVARYGEGLSRRGEDRFSGCSSVSFPRRSGRFHGVTSSDCTCVDFRLSINYTIVELRRNRSMKRLAGPILSLIQFGVKHDIAQTEAW